MKLETMRKSAGKAGAVQSEGLTLKNTVIALGKRGGLERIRANDPLLSALGRRAKSGEGDSCNVAAAARQIIGCHLEQQSRWKPQDQGESSCQFHNVGETNRANEPNRRRYSAGVRPTFRLNRRLRKLTS